MNLLTDREKIEMIIRASKLVKASADLLDVSSFDTAKLMLMNVAQNLMELDKWIKGK